MRPHVSRNDDKGASSVGMAIDATADEACDAEEGSGVKSACALGLVPLPPCDGDESCACTCADEAERTRLIADLAKLIRESPMPEGTRLAGLTLIGWLARRRLEESPHAIGIEEARQSERRVRAKPR